MTIPTTPETTEKLNGIDLPMLREAIEQIRQDPDQGQTTWKVTSQWMGGTRSDHMIDGLIIGGRKVDRTFKLQIDEPCELTGTNQFANPQEYLLAAMNACMMVGYAAVATVMGVELTRLEVETTGDIDLRGFLGIDETVKPGYDAIHQRVHIAGNGTDEQFAKMHEVVQRTSPNYFNITQPIRVESEMVVEH